MTALKIDAIGKHSPSTDIVDVGPSYARQLLEQNTANFRKPDEARIVRYAKEMTSGRWQFDAAPIRFGSDGCLLDGQHRLKAIIRSGTVQKLLIISGLDADGSTLDRGKPRTIAQWLSHNGVKNANVMAAAARLCCAHNNGLWTRVAHGAGDVVDGEIIHFAEKNRDKLQDAVYVARWARSVLTPSIGATIAFFGSGEKMPQSNELVTWFFKRLSDGVDIGENDAVLHLRNKLTSQKPGSRISPSMIRWIATKAWNKTVDGEPCTGCGLRIRSVGPSKDKVPDKIFPALED